LHHGATSGHKHAAVNPDLSIVPRLNRDLTDWLAKKS
jgi:hypothetical protein